MTVYDTSEKAMQRLLALGADAADSPAAVASRAEIVFASLPTPAIVHEVALGSRGIIDGHAVKIFVDGTHVMVGDVENPSDVYEEIDAVQLKAPPQWVAKPASQNAAAQTTTFVIDGWNPSKPAAIGNENVDVTMVFGTTGSLTTRYVNGDDTAEHLAKVRGWGDAA